MKKIPLWVIIVKLLKMNNVKKLKLFYAFLKRNKALDAFLYEYEQWQKHYLNPHPEKLEDFLIARIKGNALPILLSTPFPFSNNTHRWYDLDYKWINELRERKL